MSEKPQKQAFCPVCGQPMTWFGDHWLCTSIKVHDSAANTRRGDG